MGEILDAFDRHCRDRGQAPALWERGADHWWSFAQLAGRVCHWQDALRASHLPAGSPVAVAVGNGADFPALFLALLRLGHPMVSLDHSLPPECRLDLCRQFAIPTLLQAPGRSPHATRHGQGAPLASASAGSASIEQLTVSDLPHTPLLPNTALVKMTSGSTAQPAGICLNETALAAGIRSIGEGMEIDHRDRMLLAIPLSHSYGFDHGVLSMAVLGTSLVIESGYFPAALLRTLSTGEITFFPAVPPMIKALAESVWPAKLPLRRVISAGGPLREEFARGFHAASGHYVHQFYGSTETGGICFEQAPHEAGASSTVGHPLPGVTLELDAEQTVVVDSPANYHGTLGGPLGFTSRTDRPVTLADRGSWTACGRLRLIGRATDLLKIAGRRVSILAVESSLRRLEGVAEAAVVGVEDPVRGDRMVAFVVGQRPLAASDLPRGLLVRDIRPIEQIPYTPRGKVDRALLRKFALGEAPRTREAGG